MMFCALFLVVCPVDATALCVLLAYLTVPRKLLFLLPFGSLCACHLLQLHVHFSHLLLMPVTDSTISCPCYLHCLFAVIMFCTAAGCALATASSAQLTKALPFVLCCVSLPFVVLVPNLPRILLPLIFNHVYSATVFTLQLCNIITCCVRDSTPSVLSSC